MNTTHALFPVKLLEILKKYEKSKKGKECIHAASIIPVVKSPDDGFTRTIMSSPPIFGVINDSAVQRVRLAYKSNTFSNLYETSLELYSADGELLEIVKHPKWSMALSLAIEAELLERILNINPL